MQLLHRVRSKPALALSLVVVTAVLGVGLLFPVSQVLLTAFSPEGLDAVRALVGSSVNRGVVVNTVVLGLCVAAVGTALAFLFAFVQTRLDVPFKRVLHAIAIVPVVSPPFALATALVVLFGRNGVISQGVFGVPYDIYGLDGLTIALALSFFPVVYLTLVGMMRRLDPSLDEAATSLGAGRAKVFLTVTLPMLLPGLASGFLLLFVEAIADLANPLVLGGDFTVLSSRAYLAITGEYDVASGAVFSLSLMVPAVLVFLLQRYWIDRRKVFSVTGKPTGRPQVHRGPVAMTAYAAAVFVALLIVLVYATIVYGAFTAVPGVNNAFTLAHFDFVLFGIGSEAMVDTTVMAVVAAPLAGLLGVLIAYLVVRKLPRVGPLLDFVAMLGIAVPGTVLGIGFVLAFRSENLVAGVTVIPSLVGGAAVLGGSVGIVVVLLIRGMPAAVRAGVGSLHQIHPSIDEASASLGADDSTTFRRITLPLIRPALLAGLTFAIARSMTTLSPIVFLTTPDTKIMAAQILAEVDAGRFGNAFAYCCVLMAIVLVLIGLVRVAVRGRAVRPVRTLAVIAPTAPVLVGAEKE
ncbi:iron ABC transporter permease [Umezawaea sp. Da 62-37]|uniref:ABC transporter permease n=1 Tax=Umezawaea sp. Da 62-37 TaxID=3075927 RepID=UPI0028F6DA74|nr:iron ABC transporter permease [Umezawaea sp. Da 62-37]WNV90051.1 iron ABC transporter permease [Umezawaea sp. Da 62-37]